MKGLILATLLTIPSISVAGSISAFGGQDVLHDSGAGYGEIRYHSDYTDMTEALQLGWTAHIGQNNAIGLGLAVRYGIFELGLGIESSNPGVDIVETEGKYESRFEWNINEWLAVGLVHKSNCQKVCPSLGIDFLPHGDDDKDNKGLNYIGFRFKFIEF